MAEQLARHQSRRLQVLSPDSPPTVEGQEGVTMEQPYFANVSIGIALASETGIILGANFSLVGYFSMFFSFFDLD